jgi:hypothetical protein
VIPRFAAQEFKVKLEKKKKNKQTIHTVVPTGASEVGVSASAGLPNDAPPVARGRPCDGVFRVEFFGI